MTTACDSPVKKQPQPWETVKGRDVGYSLCVERRFIVPSRLMKSYTCLCPRGMNTSRGLSSGARRGFGLRRPLNGGRQLETGLLKPGDESLSVYATLLFVGAASGEQRRRSSPALFSFRAGDKLVGVGLLLSR